MRMREGGQQLTSGNISAQQRKQMAEKEAKRTGEKLSLYTS